MTAHTATVLRLHGAHDLRVEIAEAPAPGPGEVRLRMARGGICGSDLHYYAHGGVGAIRVREPIILGHEAAGYVLDVGPGVEGLTPGTLVSVNPSQPCGTCAQCAAGRPRHCTDMRFMGSAMFLPHAQGLYRSEITLGAAQCHPLPEGTDPGAAACAEPLAVCLHAVARAGGDLSGQSVLVTGAGPIGCLTVAAARAAGAARIVATDLNDAPLRIAEAMGAACGLNLSASPDALTADVAENGHFDTVFECSAAAPAIAGAVEALRPCGTLVQVGVAGSAELPLGRIVAREIAFLGTHRFDVEFAEAVAAIGSGRIDVAPIITATFPAADGAAALDTALDRSRSCKVLIALNPAEEIPA
ncbi:L-idonate 5-dehydrogenase [Acidimangrovimonas sediminis]|uniref:L-idonate 5-dehydrogenase n=1 Tax=Acidimangrovimonas sediminis TaxID=2056283 RepID=UPI000C80DCF0|nr:L-idonate 5-dehydrogenase [Acidimangrovimonas sediminis]